MLKHSVNHLWWGYVQLSQPLTNRAEHVFLPWHFYFRCSRPKLCMSLREIYIHVANHAKKLKSAGHFLRRIKENATKKNIISQAYEIQKTHKRLTMHVSVSSSTRILEMGHRNWHKEDWFYTESIITVQHKEIYKKSHKIKYYLHNKHFFGTIVQMSNA